MRLYHIKIANGYVKNVFMAFKEIVISPDIKHLCLLNEEKKDYVVSLFPQSEVKSFDVVEERGSQLEARR